MSQNVHKISNTHHFVVIMERVKEVKREVRKNRYALLVVDMQRAYFEDSKLASQEKRLVAVCNELLRAARKHTVPIWNVRTEHARDESTWTLNMKQDGQGFLFAGSEQAEMIAGLGLGEANEIIKTRDSAFFGTSLAQELHEQNVSHLIICGVSTQSCVTQTAADAYAADFHVILAREAIATNNPDYHDVMLRLLENEYRQEVLDTRDIIKRMAGIGS